MYIDMWHRYVYEGDVSLWVTSVYGALVCVARSCGRVTGVYDLPGCYSVYDLGRVTSASWPGELVTGGSLVYGSGVCWCVWCGGSLVPAPAAKKKKKKGDDDDYEDDDEPPAKKAKEEKPKKVWCACMRMLVPQSCPASRGSM